MDFFNITSLNSMLKSTQMSMKWEERKNNAGKEDNVNQKKSESSEVMRLKELVEDTRRANYIGGLRAKLSCGGELSKDELDYVKANCPDLYKEAVEAQAAREQYKRELENCRTQEEADRLNLNKINSYVSQVNAGSALAKKSQMQNKVTTKIMGIQNEFGKFIKAGKYDSLPSEDETKQKQKSKKKIANVTDQSKFYELVSSAISSINPDFSLQNKQETAALQNGKNEKTQRADNDNSAAELRPVQQKQVSAAAQKAYFEPEKKPAKKQAKLSVKV